ncbi:MAG TPA: NYN domain-containing protein [Candidatus Paceibacterota bacterium]|nr:NYN domain-containing protein [Candidatus Paceibacterota bacterium]
MAIIKHKSQRVGIFIDTQNLYHSAKNLYKAKVNFGNVVKEALAGRVLIRAVAYVIRTEGEEEKSFFEALNKIGIETKVKDIRIFAGGAKKADWDIGMAIDAIAMADRLDTVILATGDGDFVPLVEYLRYSSGIQVEVISFGKSSAAQLKDVVDDFIDMSDDPKNFLIGYRGGNRGGGWIPGFSKDTAAEETLNEITEPADDSNDFNGDIDPAISMSGEE